MKRFISIVFLLHTLVILYCVWYDLHPVQDDLPWGHAMMIDYPFSMALLYVFFYLHTHILKPFHMGDSLAAAVTVASVLHIVFGGLWWTLIALLLRRVVTKLRMVGV